MTVAHVYYLYSLSFHFLPRFPLFLDSIILKKKRIYFLQPGERKPSKILSNLFHTNVSNKNDFALRIIKILRRRRSKSDKN